MVSRVLLVADVPWVLNEVRASLSVTGHELVETADPTTAASAAGEHQVDAVVVDLQVASMGGMAVTRDVRARFGMAGEPPPPVVMLLDRAADGFLAKRAGADAWVVKPFTARQLRDALDRAMAGPPEAVGEDAEGVPSPAEGDTIPAG
jgi:CheY-like chemotaxis protein